MTFRERYIRTVQFASVDRLPERHAYGLMPGVLAEWRDQGLPSSITEGAKLPEYFGFPSSSVRLPIHIGPDPQFEERIIEETDAYRVAVDEWGRTTRMMKGVTTLALAEEFPVSDWDSWLRYKERLGFAKKRVGTDLRQAAAANRRSGHLNRFGAKGFYWFPRDLMSDEALAVAYYETPDLVHSINDTWCSLLEDVLKNVLGRIPVDEIHLVEDMAYKNASMIGKNLFDEFMAPYYHRLLALIKANNVPVFSVDSDGFLGELNSWFLECGVNLTGPNEVRAGNSIAEYRKTYGSSLAFDGGIDKLVLTQGRDAIDAMIDAVVPPMMESGGGWIVSLDHRVVPGTPLEDFVYYLDRIRKLTAF